MGWAIVKKYGSSPKFNGAIRGKENLEWNIVVESSYQHKNPRRS